MKTPPIIAIVLCGAARLAFAQDAGAVAGTAAATPTASTSAAGEGGHDIAVFTGVPTRSHGGEW